MMGHPHGIEPMMFYARLARDEQRRRRRARARRRAGLLGLVLLLLVGWSEVRADDWTAGDRLLAGVAVGLLETDRRQTHAIAQDPAYYETNPILGPEPSAERINAHFAAVTVGTLLLADRLSGADRKGWLLLVALIEAAYVQHNRQIGIRWEVARW